MNTGGQVKYFKYISNIFLKVEAPWLAVHDEFWLYPAQLLRLHWDLALI